MMVYTFGIAVGGITVDGITLCGVTVEGGINVDEGYSHGW